MNRQIKVGIFIFIGIVVGGILIFLVGNERHMFERQAQLSASFRDVAGLKVGSPVRMGGVDIGHVESIEIGANPRDTMIHVHFSMVASQLPRVRQDSVVHIVSKGLLGDKALDVSMGSLRSPALRDGSEVHSEETDDFGNAMHNAGEALGRANQVLDNVVAMTRPLANARLGEDVSALVHDLRVISHQAAEGPGTVHDLLTNDTMTRRIDATLASAQLAANRAAQAADNVERLTRESSAVVHSVGRLSEEVGAITHDVRTGNGGLHQIIYGNDSAQAVANVNQATAQLRDILTDVRAGRGTVGALLTDPSLYEDIKTLVGNVQRNEILRAMVRYSIHQDEGPQAPVTARPATTPTPRAP